MRAVTRAVTSVSFGKHDNTICVCFPEDISLFTLDTATLIRHYGFNQFSSSLAVAIPETSTIAFTGLHSQSDFSNKSICVYDWEKKRSILDIEGQDSVINILAAKNRFIVVYKSQVKVYNVSPVGLVAQLNGAINDLAPCDCCERDGKLMIAMTGKTLGTLSITTISDHREEKSIEAASHPLSIIRFNSDGSMIATASEKGTLIRVFDTSKPSLIMELRRGAMPAQITSMAFSPGSQYLAVLSSNGTLHVFDLNDSITDNARQRATMMWRQEYSYITFLRDDQIIAIRKASGELEYLKLDYTLCSISLEKKCVI